MLLHSPKHLKVVSSSHVHVGSLWTIQIAKMSRFWLFWHCLQVSKASKIWHRQANLWYQVVKIITELTCMKCYISEWQLVANSLQNLTRVLVKGKNMFCQRTLVLQRHCKIVRRFCYSCTVFLSVMFLDQQPDLPCFESLHTQEKLHKGK